MSTIWIKIICVFLSCFFCSCKTENKEIVYTNNAIDWEMKVSGDWDITVEDEASVKSKSESARINVFNAERDSVKPLLSFYKHDSIYNRFTSIIQPFVEEYPNHWAKQDSIRRESFVNMAKGMKLDIKVSDKYTEELNGIDFNVYKVEGIEQNGNKVAQYNYSALINGYDFNITVMAQNNHNLRAIMEMFKNSKFGE